MPYSHENLIAAFCITAGWDVILRLFSEKKIKLLGIEKWKWVATLEPYFKKHTTLAAALIAGFVGAIAYFFISYFSFSDQLGPISYLFWVIFISAIIGIPMRYSGMFPHLSQHYYKPLGFWYSMTTDAMSGVIVYITMIVLQKTIEYLKK